MSKPVVMKPGIKYRPRGYTVRDMLVEEMGRLFDAHDTLSNHSPDCEAYCIVLQLHNNHVISDGKE